MLESNKTLCKVCKQLKTRIDAGKYPDSKDKRYIDEEGKHWNGLTCSNCHMIKMKENMRNLRFSKKRNINEST